MPNIFTPYLKKKTHDAHAVLSASGSERWLGCPGSVKLSEGIPSVDNPASIRGTNTHTLLQFILENEDWKDLLQTPDGVRFRVAIDYDTAMMGNALFAAKYVWQQRAAMGKKYQRGILLLTEKKLFLKDVGYGTADIILYHPYGLLHVMDYKNGTKAVEPENNVQGLYYAHAAADLFGWEFSELHISIIQPNAPHKEGQIRTWKTDEETLSRAGHQFVAGARATQAPRAPLVKNDSWCWFCPARQKCPEHQDKREEKLFDRFQRG